jgi:hypothetical protein
MVVITSKGGVEMRCSICGNESPELVYLPIFVDDSEGVDICMLVKCF